MLTVGGIRNCGKHGGTQNDPLFKLRTSRAEVFRIAFWDVLPCKISVDNYFTRQYIPEDNSEHHTRRRENLKSHIEQRCPTTHHDTMEVHGGTSAVDGDEWLVSCLGNTLPPEKG
jgi:hypothetical protein